MKPPPTPKKPVSAPTVRPATRITPGRAGGQPSFSSAPSEPERCQVAPAAMSTTGTKARMRSDPLTAALAMAPSSEPAAAGIEKIRASRQQT